MERNEISNGIEHLRGLFDRLQALENEIVSEMRYCASDDSGLMAIDTRLMLLSSQVREIKYAAAQERLSLESALAR